MYIIEKSRLESKGFETIAVSVSSPDKVYRRCYPSSNSMLSPGRYKDNELLGSLLGFHKKLSRCLTNGCIDIKAGFT